MKHSGQFRAKGSHIAMALAIVFAGLLGSYHASTGWAATETANPMGYIDSCSLQNGATVITGWAYDPNDKNADSQPYVNITAGSQTHKNLPTNLNYRTNAINTNDISTHYASTVPKPGMYGWTTTFTGLYKGTSNAVSGTVLNYGAGTNQAILIHVANSLDGQTVNGFPGNKVPDACMPAKPASPPPSSPPPPSPPPVDNGGDTSNNDTGSTDNSGDAGSGNSDTANTSQTSVSNAADGQVTVGTNGASVKFSVGGGATAHLNYGTDAQNLISATDDKPIGGADATINIDNLDALTNYQFEIVRTASDGTTSTSAPAAFKTKGYTISLHFTDGSKKGVAGIQGSINDDKKTKATSDSGGTMSFTDLPSGAYTVTYSYKGKTHTDDFDTNNTSVSSGSNNPTADTTPQTAVLSDTIDLSKLGEKLGVGGGSAKSGSKAGGVVLFIVILLALAGFIFWVLRRRRRAGSAGGNVLPTPYDPTISKPDIIDQQMTQHFNDQQPQSTEPAPAHMGESLRDMVIKSMHEEAQKKKSQQR